MEWLNYHHLHYFWAVAEAGSITGASRRLRLSPSTVSAQVRALEDRLGAKLFDRVGRRLVPTESGRMVHRYAQRIFSLGDDLVHAVHGGESSLKKRLRVGVADALPKIVAYRLLEPAMRTPVQLVCREGRPDRLAAELANDDLDLVLADAPVPAPRVHGQILGESGVSFFGTPALARGRRSKFPASLDGSPFVLPLPGTSLRSSLDRWFEAVGVAPAPVGEFEDGALLVAFGQAGAGIFAAPTVVEDALVEQLGVVVIGRVDAIRERFYAMTTARETQLPAVLAITEAARRELFA